jgi:hypothetical protein
MGGGPMVIVITVMFPVTAGTPGAFQRVLPCRPRQDWDWLL